MFQKIVRSTSGALFFVKNNKKQQITDWASLAGSLIDEIGCKTISDKELSTLQDFKFFGKV